MFMRGDPTGALSHGLIPRGDYVSVLSHGLMGGNPINAVTFTTAIRRIIAAIAGVRRVSFTRTVIAQEIDPTRNPRMNYQVRVGDTGTKVTLQIVDETGAPVDVSGATVTITMKRDAGGAAKVFAGVLDTDGTDGRIFCLTLADTWDASGRWHAQALTVLGGTRFYSEPVVFIVGANL